MNFNAGSITITCLLIAGYLVYLYRSAVSFKAFLRLPEVKVVFFGGSALVLNLWIANRFFNVPNSPDLYEKEEEPTYDHVNLPSLYSDTLYNQPLFFFPYIVQITDQLDAFQHAEVKHFIAEEEYRHVYDYWRITSLNRTQLQEPTESNLGYLYSGYFSFYEKKDEQAVDHLLRANDTLPYRNYFLGILYTRLKKFDLADKAFRREGALRGDTVSKEAYVLLAKNYLNTGQVCDFLALAPLSRASQDLVPNWRLRLMHFKCKGPLAYYRLAIEHYYGDVKWYTVLSSFFMSLLWMVYFYLLDVFKRDKQGLLLGIFVMEMVFMILFLLPWLDLQEKIYGIRDNGFWLDYVLRIGVPEEGIKIMPFLLVLGIFWKKFDEPYDILLLAIFSACGFAFMENMLYLEGYSHRVMSLRTILSTLGHIVATSIVAYGFVLLKFHPHPLRKFKLVWYFFVACFVHGLFDYLLTYDLFFLSLLLFFVGLTFVAILINNCLNNSPQFTFKVLMRSMRLVEMLVLGFMAVIIYEYWMLNFTKGTGYANYILSSNLFLHFGLLFLVTTKLSNFDMVKGFWKEIYLIKVPAEFKAKSVFNPFHFIVQYFVSNSIYPQNFVGLKIKLTAHFHYPDLARLLQGTRQGVFADRIVVTEYEKASPSKQISFLSEKFFVVVLRHPLVYQRFSSPVLLLRFRSNTVGLGSIPKQSVKLYFVDDLKKVKKKSIDLRDFPYLGMAVIHVDEEISA